MNAPLLVQIRLMNTQYFQAQTRLCMQTLGFSTVEESTFGLWVRGRAPAGQCVQGVLRDVQIDSGGRHPGRRAQM
jgi:hypothetical protein